MKSILIFIISTALYAQYTATISTTDQQVVKGFGCCPIWIDNHEITAQPLVEQAAYGMGATIIRHSQLPGVGDGNGNINTTAADKLCRAIQLTTSRGLPYILSNWSPPAGMKTIAVNGSVSNGTPVYLSTNKEQTFCTFVVALMRYISVTKGLPLPIGYSMQNEPTCETPWAGCIYTPEQYRRVTKLLRTTLDTARLTPVNLIGPEDGGYYNGQGWNWSTAFLGGTGFPFLTDTAYNNAIAVFASHSYDWNPSTTIAHFNDWINGCDTWDKDRCQTEYCYIENTTYPHMIGTTRRLISDFAFLKNNYWFTWIVSDASDVPDALCFGNGSTTLTKKPAYYVLKKIFSSIPIDSKVRRMTSTDNGLTTANSNFMDMVAFVSDTSMTVIIVNPLTTARTTNINGLFGSSAKVYQISGTTNNTDLSLLSSPTVSNGTISNINLPANSVTVINTRGSSTHAEMQTGNKASFEVFPSIASTGITIKPSNIINENYSIKICDIAGRVLISKSYKKNETRYLDINKLNSGIYFVYLDYKNNNVVRRIIVNR